MEDTNNQNDPMDNDNNDGIMDESSVTEVEGREDEDKPPLRLDNNILQGLNQNDLGVTNLSVSLSDEYFNTIDWKEEGDCIANNTQLKKLRISFNSSITYWLGKWDNGQDLPTREQLQDFFSCVYQNSSIASITFSSIQMFKFGGDILEGLQGHSSLTKLEIAFGKLGSTGCDALGKVLAHTNSKLRDLRLPNCDLVDEGIRTLCGALMGNSTLKKFCLSGNRRITSAGWRVLSNVVRHPNCKLTTLVLISNSINDEGADVLGSAFRGSSLQSLILGYNPSISSGWQTLLNQLSQTSVEHLDLSDNKIDDNGLTTLASISTLKSLDICNNRSITSSGLQSFFNSLQTRGTQLVKLNISGNEVRDICVAALSSLLRNMNTLKELYMNGMMNFEQQTENSVYITSQGWVSFFRSLQGSNLDLVDLKLGSNSIDDGGMQLLVRLVSGMTSPKYLNLGYNPLVTPAGWQALADYFQGPEFALEDLHISENRIDDDTVVVLTSALAHNKTLKVLNLYQDDDADEQTGLITERGWSVISNLLYNKTSIMDTYNSNHTLQDVGGYYAPLHIIPNHLAESLELNKNKDKIEVARQKILQTHFSTEEADTTSKMQELLDMELKMIPTIVEWIGRPLSIGWEGAQVSGLSLLYNLMHRLPDLFDWSPQKKSSAAKRKRSV